MAASKLPSGESVFENNNYLYPIAVLDDELKNEDLQICIYAVKNLSTIALALGVEDTREKLMDFLTEKIFDIEGDIMIVLAEVLGNFVDYVGGPEFVYTLLSPLESLAVNEESVVREKAVESLRKLAPLHSPVDLENYFVHLISRLVKGHWFTSRLSACCLFTVVYPRVSTKSKNKLCQLYYMLCQDESLKVKICALENLGEFAQIVCLDTLKNKLIPIFTLLSRDIEESVRASTLETCVSIAPRLTHEDIKELVLPLLRTFTSDNSWKVRAKVAHTITELQKVVGPEITRADLVPIFLLLLSDGQDDVRAVAAFKVCDFCKNLIPPVASGAYGKAKISNEIDLIILKSIFPVIKGLVMDKDEKVRLALSSVIMEMSDIFGKQRTLEHLLPIFLTMLKDVCFKVRLNMIIHLECVNGVIGIEQLYEKMLPAVFELCDDPKWQICLEIIEYIPLLACQLDMQLFTDNYLGLCISWLTNHVYAIREAGILNLKKLVEIFGTEWAQKLVIPNIIPIAKNPKYLYRMSFLFCINELAEVCGPEITAELMLPTVLSMVNDRVANVRFNVAKTLEKIGLKQCAEVNSGIKPTLIQLSADKDTDVQYFAAEAISNIPWN